MIWEDRPGNSRNQPATPKLPPPDYSNHSVTIIIAKRLCRSILITTDRGLSISRVVNISQLAHYILLEFECRYTIICLICMYMGHLLLSEARHKPSSRPATNGAETFERRLLS